jgi:hypothetical protein
MKEIVKRIVSWDDVDLETGVKTPADITVILTIDYGEAGRKQVKLDLAEAHVADLEGDVARWFAIGNPTRLKKKKQDKAPVDRVLDELGIASHSPERREWLIRFREWADGEGRMHEYERPSGGIYYPRPLIDDYLAVLQERKAG